MAALLYGAGLRLPEWLRLRVKEVAFDRNEILVRTGNGGGNRRTLLPRHHSGSLAQHLTTVRRLHDRD